VRTEPAVSPRRRPSRCTLVARQAVVPLVLPLRFVLSRARPQRRRPQARFQRAPSRAKMQAPRRALPPSRSSRPPATPCHSDGIQPPLCPDGRSLRRLVLWPTR
jgi:hypothetical protein